MAVDLKPYNALTPQSSVGPYRASDYFALPDDERCELIHGRLYASPSPIYLHQIVILVLAGILDRALQASGGFVGLSPLDVTLAEHTVVQPDILCVSHARRGIIQDRIEGAPDLVVEVISPGSGLRDRTEKTRLYASSGVAEYWQVDPQERQIAFLVLRDGAYQLAEALDEAYSSPVLPDVSLNIAEFWREVEGHLPRS